MVEGAVSLIDLAPTLLELLGIPSAGEVMQSLVPVLVVGASVDPARPIFLYRRESEPCVERNMTAPDATSDEDLERLRALGNETEGPALRNAGRSAGRIAA